MIRNKNIYLFYLGFVSAVSQILLLKEFLISFYGNELSIGIVLSVWLFWVAAGSFTGNKINRKIERHEIVFCRLMTLLPMVTIGVIVLIKYAASILHTPAGEYESISTLTSFAFFILSVNCFLTGYLFSLGAGLPDSGSKKVWMSVNRAYAYESLGSVAGGLVFTFILNKIFSPFQILAALSFFMPFYIIIRKYNGKLKYAMLAIILVLAFFIISFVIIPENFIIKEHWKTVNDQMNYISTINTKYQNLTLLQLNEQYTLYSDGKPVINFPDRYSSELYVHPIFAQVENPGSVLLIGSGGFGLLEEILKYNVHKIDYIELDNNLIPMVKPYLDSAAKNSLKDPRVNIINEDGREFVSNTANKYDVIILASGDPSTLNQNRYYTYEFFERIKNILGKQGIFSIAFSSSEDYLGDELKNYNISIYRTFKKVFNNLILMPGTKAFLIGAHEGGYLSCDEHILTERYKAYNLHNIYFSGYLFGQLLQPERISYMLNTFEEYGNSLMNGDGSPITYYFNIVLWNKIAKTELFSMGNLSQVRLEYFYLLILIIPLLIIVIRFYRREKISSGILHIIMFVAGFSGLIISLLMMMNFQTVFGSVYESVGIMISMNMLGLFAGSMLYGILTEKTNSKYLSVLISLSGFLFVILLPFSLNIISMTRIIFLSFFIMFSYNTVIGLIYSNINHEYLKFSRDVGRIYSVDVFGSLLGAAFFSSLLLPLFGALNIAYFIIILFAVILLLALLNEFYK